MVVNHVIPEIHYIIPEMQFRAFMYFQYYMADNHVTLETCFTYNLQVCNVGVNHVIPEICMLFQNAFSCIHVFPELRG
jgi:hypothetical protein